MTKFDGLQIKDAHLRAALEGREFLLVDGGMGTSLQARGLAQPGVVPELLTFSHPAAITEIHREFVEAGAEVITINTFGGNRLKLAEAGPGAPSVAEVFAAAAECARAAGAPYVAGDIGPTGALLEPLGTMSADEAYELFAEQVFAAVEAGCDLLIIETMADLREAKMALLAAKENSALPVFVTMTFGEDGRTFLGTPPEVAAELFSAMGAQAVGFNCSLGPAELVDAAEAMARRARVPLMAQPNAGLPRVVDGATVFDVGPAEFAQAMRPIVAAGASILGGCCGTTPDFTRALRALIDERGGVPARRAFEPGCALASAQELLLLASGREQVAVVGERINPTGKPKLKAALRAGDLDYLVGEAVAQLDAGADVLDVNVGLPELDEPAVLAAAVEKLQATIAAPLVIDSSDPAAIEAAVRAYPGKPLINSVNGKAENLAAVLPIVAKYGCAVIGLALDEGGIPSRAEERFAIAERIVAAAEEHGIAREDVVIDCLTMAVATNQAEAVEILRAIRLVKERLGCRTVLGVSNISFGLPQRNLMNSTFLAAALGCGLDFPILNPLAGRYQDVVNSFRVVNAQDEGAVAYIARYADAADPYEAPVGGGGEKLAAANSPLTSGNACPIKVPAALEPSRAQVEELVALVLAGRRGPIPALTRQLLEVHETLEIINGVFVPALDVVGEKFESGAFFLPQLMAAAEAVKAGFDVAKEQLQAAAEAAGCTDSALDAPGIIVATVKGDIHDIGKNIVKMLLENYGFRVVDLGRDVEPAAVLAAVQETGISLVGLSALMTTTVRAMEETIELLHAEAPHVRTFVGGAVLTPEYAEMIGADFYAKDAAESVRVAERFFAEGAARG